MIKLILSLWMVSFSLSQKLRIPDNLIYCYRGNFTEFWYPQTLPVLIEIVRKIEASRPTSIDLRHISARLFHDLRVDGIHRSPHVETEDVTPFGRNGVMSHKNIVLRQLISNVPGEFDYQQILTQADVCTLHKLLSSSVEPYERHDELRNCPRQILNSTMHQRPISKLPRPRDPSVHHRQPHSNFTIVAPNLSRCPIETGVVFDTNGFAIHPGVIIANIASGLQPQQVRIGEFISEFRALDPFENLETMEATDNRKKISKLLSSLNSVDNTYASGLVGDLAEVVLFQGPSGVFTIGVGGLWNDTDLPRMFHLNGSQRGNWHMTDSEILSGIDGLFVSQQVAAWTSRIRRLRLSQVLEMFYLHQGISIPTIESNVKRIFKGRNLPPISKPGTDQSQFEHDIPVAFDASKSFKKPFAYTKLKEEMMDVDLEYLSRFSVAEDISSVCHRRKIVEMIDVDKLKEETYSFVQILEFVTNTPLMPATLLKTYSDAVVDQMMQRAKELVAQTPDCIKLSVDHKRTAVDLTVIIDGSRTAYENLQLINTVSEMIDLSSFGSYISVIHGSTGQFLVNRTNSIADLFEQLRNSSTIDNPIRLSLSNSFRSLMLQLVNQTSDEKAAGVFGALPKVCLVVSQSHRIGESDFESAQRILQGTMGQFPDLFFIFLSNDVNTFREMVSGTRESASNAKLAMETLERYHYVATNSIRISTFKSSLDLTFRSIPKRIASPFCKTTDKRSWDDVMRRDDFEEYLTPNEETRYRISSFYLLGADEIKIKFQGAGYGDFTVCVSRSHDMLSRECKSIQDMENAWFNITKPCIDQKADEGCLSVYFGLQVDTTYMRCSETDCRFPDDVRIIVRPEGLRCERNKSGRVVVKFTTLILTFFIAVAHWTTI